MATLTPEQTDFLKSHHIPLDKAFDASGLSTKEYKAKMKATGTLIAYGVPPCDKGHTIRNKQGNCVQCSPHAIASIKRQATSGHVYIAASAGERLLKISTTTDACDMATQLNTQQHAGIRDWQILLVGEVGSIGQTENQLQQLFSRYQVPKKLEPNGKTTKASQIYDLDIDEAIDRLNDIKFTLTEIDTPAVENFHRLYSEQAAIQQAHAERLAQQQAEQQAAEAQQREQQKQAQLEQKRQQQEQARQAKEQQKLEQKRQREAEREQKQQAAKATVATAAPATTSSNAVASSKSQPPASATSSGIMGRVTGQDQKLIWVAVAVLLLLASIAAIVFSKTS